MLPKNKNLVIFDFDHTLCKSNGVVYFTNKITGISDRLTAKEYINWRVSTDYTENPSAWDLDFTEFTGYPRNGIIINQVFSKLDKHLENPDTIVALVTGRDELAGPKRWLEDHGVDTTKMILICTGDPDKTPSYESLINTLEPISIVIYEDSRLHLLQCSEVCAKYNINLTMFLIEESKDGHRIISI